MMVTKQETRKLKKKSAAGIRFFDYSLVTILICLICFGLVMLYSSSSYNALVDYGDSMYYFRRQVIFYILGFAIVFFVEKIDYHYYIKLAWPAYIIAIVMMSLVQTPLGIEVNGAKRWLRLPGGFQLQPSEIMKVAIILLIPALICKLGSGIKTIRGVGWILLWGGIAAACVLYLTDNLSTAIIVFGMTCIMIFVAHPKTKPFVIIVAGALVLLAAAILILKKISMGISIDSDSFRLKRIIVWLNPEQYASDKGYQTMQGLYAIGSGGFFGKGLGNSTQKMVIPEVHNDMILSVVCEELGVFGVLMLLTLFGLLLYRLMFIAQNAPDVYGSLVVTGIFAHIALQVMLNVMVVTNVIPNTGITLPFISYGGTSSLFLMIELGIALGVSRTIKFDE